jgi:L-gulono-1,4-lactone dehydrogenase
MSVGVLPKLRLTRPSVKPVSAARPASEPAETLQVQCERDIVDAVCLARERMCEVRPFGGKGSKNDCYGTDGLSLDLSGYGGVLAFDGRTVTVQAGMKVGRLNEFLRHRGAIVPTCGEWQGATVSGSLSTGSHGGSSHYGIHPTSVIRFRLVTADGLAMDIGRDSPYFEHAGVSMGMLGVISTVTLACEPAFHLELQTRVVPLDDYLRDCVTNGNAASFSAAVWFPTVRRVLTFTANRVPARAATGPRMQRFSIKTFLFDAASRYLDMDVVSDDHLAHTWVDEGDRILCPIEDTTAKMRVLRALSHEWRATELAVPVEAAPVVIERIDRVLHDHRDSMLNATGLRMSPADTFSLSPCYGRDTFWIDVFFDEWDRQFAYDLAETVADYGGRCHWGKYLALDPAHLRAQYPRLNQFRMAKAELDPDRLFDNAYTRRMRL